MAKLVTINNCGNCPHCKMGIDYSLDGFDRGQDAKCGLTNKIIAKFIERASEWKNIDIPEWCPLDDDNDFLQIENDLPYIKSKGTESLDIIVNSLDVTVKVKVGDTVHVKEYNNFDYDYFPKKVLKIDETKREILVHEKATNTTYWTSEFYLDENDSVGRYIKLK